MDQNQPDGGDGSPPDPASAAWDNAPLILLVAAVGPAALLALLLWAYLTFM